MRTHIAISLLCAAIPLCHAPPQARAESVMKVAVDDETIVEIRTKVRHTTVIRLPQEETILDFVIGDSEFWGIAGTGNVAYLKPSGEGASTNVALVTQSGRIYSLLAREGGDPHLAVYIERSDVEEEPGPIGTPVPEPMFLPRASLRDAEDQARLAREQAREAVANAQTALEQGVASYKQKYPRELRFPYRLEPKASDWPFLIEAMWHDGLFTFLRSSAPEAPAIYELKDGKPSMVEYEFRDGLYITKHVVGEGWLQIGKERRRWEIRDLEAFGAQVARAADVPRP